MSVFSFKDAYIVVQRYSKESNNSSFINPSKNNLFNVGCVFKGPGKFFDCLVNFKSDIPYINQKQFYYITKDLLLARYPKYFSWTVASVTQVVLLQVVDKIFPCPWFSLFFVFIWPLYEHYLGIFPCIICSDHGNTFSIKSKE